MPDNTLVCPSALEDLSSDDDMFAPTEATAQFMKGHTVHCDVHAFSKAMTRHIQGGPMSSYDITRQVRAWASRCDDITHRAAAPAVFQPC